MSEHQGNMFDERAVGVEEWDEPEADEEPTIQRRFEAFDSAHPDVYREFKAMAIKLRDRGLKHHGAKAIIEVIRYHKTLSSSGTEPYKLNNIFTSRFVRKLIDERPDFADFFELRKLKSE